VVQIRLQEQLREDLGKTYSPSASSSTSRVWRNYGTFSLTASVDKTEVEATRAAVRAMVQSLRTEPVDQDTLDRARQPLLESYDNMLKSLGGWMTLADRAQSEEARLGRFFLAPDILQALTPIDLARTAAHYLDIEQAVELLVIPDEKT
jgi:zinc protease